MSNRDPNYGLVIRDVHFLGLTYNNIHGSLMGGWESDTPNVGVTQSNPPLDEAPGGRGCTV